MQRRLRLLLILPAALAAAFPRAAGETLRFENAPDGSVSVSAAHSTSSGRRPEFHRGAADGNAAFSDYGYGDVSSRKGRTPRNLSVRKTDRRKRAGMTRSGGRGAAPKPRVRATLRAV